MFNFGSNCCNGGYDDGLWGCLINLIILFIVLEFLSNIINGTCGAPGLNCGC